MHKIEQLIEELCPQGVEFKALGDVIKLKKGKQLNKELLSKNGRYPAYNGGISYSGFTNNYNYNENTIIISQGGASAGFVNFVTTKFYANAHCYVVLPKTEMVKTRYFYHFLKLNQEKITNKQHGAGIPALKTSEVLDIPIPIPPLTIQKEIVKILDHFTQLEAELEAELEARKKQYEHYREALLTFGDDVERRALREVCTNHDSKRKPVTKSARQTGKYPYYGASGIVDYVSEYIFDGDYLLISEDGANLLARKTPIAFPVSGKTWINNHAHVLKFDNLVTQKYIEFYLNSISLIDYITGAAQPKLNKGNLNKIKIPFPPLSKQKEIVAILDKFDALVNDISTGLPAEITARKKQYEYYRNQLLTFKPLEQEDAN